MTVYMIISPSMAEKTHFASIPISRNDMPVCCWGIPCHPLSTLCSPKVAITKQPYHNFQLAISPIQQKTSEILKSPIIPISMLVAASILKPVHSFLGEKIQHRHCREEPMPPCRRQMVRQPPHAGARQRGGQQAEGGKDSQGGAREAMLLQ